MKPKIYALFLLLFLGIFSNSCELMEEENFDSDDLLKSSFESGNSGLPPYLLTQLESFKSVTLNTYNVEFINRMLTEKDGVIVSTTFHYKVSGTNQTPQLDSFFLEVPPCAGPPLSWSALQSSKYEDNSIKWNRSISKDGSENFSITYAGNVSEGIIEATVVRGSDVQKGLVIGPCKNIYTLKGSIFIDANEDGTKQVSESGISGIEIKLINNVDNKELATVLTSGDGSYSFKILKGDYSILSTASLLNNNYTPTTPISLLLGSISENKSDLDFGYLVDSKKVTDELNGGVIQTNNEPTKYWAQQIRQAGKRNSVYTNEQILHFLNEIEKYLLPEPFKFGLDKKKDALEILSNPVKTELDAFLQQLLTAQLNIVSGRGALNPDKTINVNFNLALMIYSEAIACTEMGVCPSTAAGARIISKSDLTSVSSRTLGDDTRMLSAFNGTGGLGSI